MMRARWKFGLLAGLLLAAAPATAGEADVVGAQAYPEG
jgi:hypothetical protein